MVEPQAKAVVLLSGGMDSATALAVARRDGFECHALSFDYGQRQRIELGAARRIAEAQAVAEHLVLRVDLSSYGGSALTDNIPVPKDRPLAEIGLGVPVTYVPARNTIFLAHGLGYAEAIGAYDLFIGANAVDYSGYPDCRPEFIDAFESLANLATGAAAAGRGTFRVHAPLMRLSKGEIIRLGLSLGVDYALTHTCYDPHGELACGRCDACQIRLAGFQAVGLADPARYDDLAAQESAAP
jgi:7-cyano-7-deazaguanine synthase